MAENTDLRVGLADLAEWQAEGLEWLRYDYPLEPGDLVVDIGSYQGEFRDNILKKFGDVSVMEFDPQVNYALWKYDGKMRMGGGAYYTSVWADGPTAAYPCRDAVKELNGLEIALCKINVEGAEYELLKYLIDGGIHKHIKYLQVQFHKIRGIDTDSLYDYLADRLRQTHKIQWQHKYIWESWERLIH